MFIKGLILTAAAFALTVAGTAADLTGKWVASTPGFDGGTTDTVFRLKQSGETLTGTVESMSGDQKIEAGKVNGDSVSFMIVDRLLPGIEVKTIYKGTVSGNELKLTRTMDDGQGGQGRGGPGGPGGPGAEPGPGAPSNPGGPGGPGAEGGRGGGRGGRFGSGEMIAKKVG